MSLNISFHSRAFPNTFNFPSLFYSYKLKISSVGERRFTYLSNNFHELTGTSIEEILNDHWLFYLRIDDNHYHKFLLSEEESITSFTPFRTEISFKSETHDNIWLYIECKPSIDENSDIHFETSIVNISNWKINQSQIFRRE
jgi:hypothetical protein